MSVVAFRRGAWSERNDTLQIRLIAIDVFRTKVKKAIDWVAEAAICNTIGAFQVTVGLRPFAFGFCDVPLARNVYLSWGLLEGGASCCEESVVGCF